MQPRANSVAFLKKAHVHPSGLARPILQKNNFEKLKVSPFSFCSDASAMREKNEHSAQSKHLLNLTKEGFQNKNTSSQSHVGEHGLLRAK